MACLRVPAGFVSASCLSGPREYKAWIASDCKRQSAHHTRRRPLNSAATAYVGWHSGELREKGAKGVRNGPKMMSKLAAVLVDRVLALEHEADGRQCQAVCDEHLANLGRDLGLLAMVGVQDVRTGEEKGGTAPHVLGAGFMRMTFSFFFDFFLGDYCSFYRAPKGCSRGSRGFRRGPND